MYLKANRNEQKRAGKSVHDHGEGGHSDLRLLPLVLENGQQLLADLLGHRSAETTHRIDGLHANEGRLALLLDDLAKILDGVVQSGISDGLEDEDLIVGGLGLFPLLDQRLLVLLLLSASADLLHSEILLLSLSGLVLADGADGRTEGQPGGLLQDGRAVGNLVLGNALEDVRLLLGGRVLVGDEDLKRLDGLSGRDLLLQERKKWTSRN